MAIEKEQSTHLMALQPSAKSDNQITSQPLKLKEPHQSEDGFIERQGFLVSTCSQDDDSDKDDTQSPSSASKACLCNNEEIALQELVSPPLDATGGPVEPEAMAEDSGRERLKRHRVEVAGRVWIPDIWGQEDMLKDWIDCSAFDAPLVPNKIMTARAALVEEGRRANAGGFRIENRC